MSRFMNDELEEKIRESAIRSDDPAHVGILNLGSKKKLVYTYLNIDFSKEQKELDSQSFLSFLLRGCAFELMENTIRTAKEEHREALKEHFIRKAKQFYEESKTGGFSLGEHNGMVGIKFNKNKKEDATFEEIKEKLNNLKNIAPSKSKLDAVQELMEALEKFEKVI